MRDIFIILINAALFCSAVIMSAIAFKKYRNRMDRMELERHMHIHQLHERLNELTESMKELDEKYDYWANEIEQDVKNDGDNFDQTLKDLQYRMAQVEDGVAVLMEEKDEP